MLFKVSKVLRVRCVGQHSKLATEPLLKTNPMLSSKGKYRECTPIAYVIKKCNNATDATIITMITQLVTFGVPCCIPMLPCQL